MRDVPLESWKRGDAITAEKLNQPVNALLAQRGVSQPQQANPQPRTSQVRQFILVSVEGDSLICHTWDGTTEGGEGIRVAKPYLLRQTPFDGAERNGIAYAYSSATARTAMQGSTSESQVIVPSYVAGDVLYAARGILGGIDVEATDWLDLNVDGRAWAKVFVP